MKACAVSGLARRKAENCCFSFLNGPKSGAGDAVMTANHLAYFYGSKCHNQSVARPDGSHANQAFGPKKSADPLPLYCETVWIFQAIEK